MNVLKFSIALLFGSFLLHSCIRDTCTEYQTVTVYDPIYEDVDVVRSKVKAAMPAEPESTGALYYYEDYLFINEPGKGIHIYDNRDKRNPKNIAMIEAQGSRSLSIQNDILYFDNFMDLFVFDLSDIANPKLIRRVDDVFAGHYVRKGSQIVVDYNKSIKEFEFDCNQSWFDRGVFGGFDENVILDGGGGPKTINNTNSSSISNNVVGVGGSLARFTIAFNRLYVVEDSGLRVFSLDNPELPVAVSSVRLGWGIETIFPYGDHLFIGSRTGMFIFDVTDRNQPSLLSRFAHANVCDPVVASGDRAYVTLRSGTRCEGFTNELNVLDISNLLSPVLLKVYEMDNPHGLSVRDNILYICDGASGLKVFDRSDDYKIDKNQLDHVDISAFDVISLSKDHLLVVGENGLYQFDSSDPRDLKELSLIAVK